MEKEREREIDRLYHSYLAKWPQQLGLDHADARISFQVSHMGSRNQGTWAIFHYFPMCIRSTEQPELPYGMLTLQEAGAGTRHNVPSLPIAAGTKELTPSSWGFCCRSGSRLYKRQHGLARFSQSCFSPPMVKMPIVLLITRNLFSAIKQAPKGFLLEVVN